MAGHIHLLIRTEEFPFEGSIRFKADITVSNLKYRTTLDKLLSWSYQVAVRKWVKSGAMFEIYVSHVSHEGRNLNLNLDPKACQRVRKKNVSFFVFSLKLTFESSPLEKMKQQQLYVTILHSS
jgi:hypothetical protein